jgi:hypothetical protein
METASARIERIENRLAIEDLNSEFCYCLDHGRAKELAHLFTKDCLYSHGSRVSSGREEVLALFAGRLGAGVRTSRHLQTSLKITFHNTGKATGTSVCLTFACDQVPPVSPATPFLVADFTDEYLRSKGGIWLIQRRHIERIFTADNNPGPVMVSDKLMQED